MSLIIKNDNLLKDIKVIENEKFFDERGFFSKIFHKEIKKNLKINIDEIFYSVNKKGVIRGIHYQKKDKQLGKIVGCLDGEILDFFIDLRKDSETRLADDPLFTSLMCLRDKKFDIFFENSSE